MGDGGCWALVFDEARGVMGLRGPGAVRDLRVLDEFATYDDALDAMADIRALCVGGLTVADVVGLTYDALPS